MPKEQKAPTKKTGASEPCTEGIAARAMRWATLTRALRAFFAEQGFVEVDTPVLIAAPAQEDFIDPIAVDVRGLESTPVTLSLQPSPELMMKRLLASGLPKIFQIAPVFRDNDNSPTHAPEFRLLEWYRRDAPLCAMQNDCEALIDFVAKALTPNSSKMPAAVDWPRPYPRIRVEDAFLRFAGFSPLGAEGLFERVRAAGYFCDPSDTPSELFGRVFAGVVEPKLFDAMGKQPFFLTHFPAYEAALAQLCPDDPRVAERFELYGGGLELANAFNELTCAKEQRERFVSTQAARKGRGQRTFPLDEAYLGALEQLGAASGIALGLERLMMALLGEDELCQVRPWFT